MFLRHYDFIVALILYQTKTFILPAIYNFIEIISLLNSGGFHMSKIA